MQKAFVWKAPILSVLWFVSIDDAESICMKTTGTFSALIYYSWLYIYDWALFPANKWVRFDVIYYEYGALVLDFSQADKATRVFNILKDAVFDEKQLLVLLLPNIQVRLEGSVLKKIWFFSSWHGIHGINESVKLDNQFHVDNLW